jgi:hypothetical protein
MNAGRWYLWHEVAAAVIAKGAEPGASKEQQAAAAGHARGIVEDIRAQPAVADFASLSVALQALRRLAVAQR